MIGVIDDCSYRIVVGLVADPPQIIENMILYLLGCFRQMCQMCSEIHKNTIFENLGHTV